MVNQYVCEVILLRTQRETGNNNLVYTYLMTERINMFLHMVLERKDKASNYLFKGNSTSESNTYMMVEILTKIEG